MKKKNLTTWEAACIITGYGGRKYRNKKGTVGELPLSLIQKTESV